MTRYRLAPEADLDIEEIAVYTLEAWGEEQTEAYLFDLALAFESISTSPSLGQERKEIKTGIFSRNFQKHIIFYRVDDAQTEILRILHHARDIPREFE